MDSTLLSKIELGHRFPNPEQAASLARFFGVPVEGIEGCRIMSKFWREHGKNPAVADTVLKIQETVQAYVVNKPGNKRGKTS